MAIKWSKCHTIQISVGGLKLVASLKVFFSFFSGLIMFCVLPWSCFVISLQKPLGLLSLLDEESTFPNGTDFTFANKLKQHLSSNSCFRGERDKAFTISHYAGEVFATCWLTFCNYFVHFHLSILCAFYVSPS